MENKACPICNKINYKILINHGMSLNLPDGFSIIKCNTCNLIRLDPIPTEEDYKKHYENSNYYSQEEYSIRAKKKKYFFEDRLSLIKKYLGHNERKILDIGCAGGDFLAIAKEQEWQVSGVEPTNNLRVQAISQVGNDIFSSLTEAYKNITNIDCVHSNHSYEHVLNPLKTINEVLPLLRKGGIFVVEVPYQFGSWRDLIKLMFFRVLGKNISFKIFKIPVDSLHHTYFYTPNVIKNILESSGMKIEYLSTFNESYYRPELISPIKGFFYKKIDFIASLINRGNIILCIARKI